MRKSYSVLLAILVIVGIIALGFIAVGEYGLFNQRSRSTSSFYHIVYVSGTIDVWSYRFYIAENNSMVFEIEYVGDNVLVVKDPLLPLISGLQFTIEDMYSGNKTIRKPGVYYRGVEKTIMPGEKDSILLGKWSSSYKRLYVYGSILGKTPFKLVIEFPSQSFSPMEGICINTTKTKTITLTEIVSVCGCGEELSNSTNSCTS